MKGKFLRKNILHEKTAASVLLKPFISSNEWSVASASDSVVRVVMIQVTIL